jgi:hypothetical protein
VFVAIEMEKLWVKSRLRLHLPVQFHHQLRGQFQACCQHSKVRFLVGSIHIDRKQGLRIEDLYPVMAG